MKYDWQSLTGQQPEADLAITPHEGIRLHPEVTGHLDTLRLAAEAAGFGLRIASGFRSFDRQKMIWNAKAGGQRPVMDSAGCPLDLSLLTDDEKLFALLRWSAIPGCSRHHWGSDMDIYDARAIPADYTVQLTPAEVTGAGPFTAMHDWLDSQLAKPDAVFFRPYDRDTGGIAPERWHLSCRPVAQRFEHLLDEHRLIDWLCTQDIALKDNIRSHWHTIFHRYVLPATPV